MQAASERLVLGADEQAGVELVLGAQPGLGVRPAGRGLEFLERVLEGLALGVGGLLGEQPAGQPLQPQPDLVDALGLVARQRAQ